MLEATGRSVSDGVSGPGPRGISCVMNSVLTSWLLFKSLQVTSEVLLPVMFTPEAHLGGIREEEAVNVSNLLKL